MDVDARHDYWDLLVAGHEPSTLTQELHARRPAWMRRGACRGADPDIFFPSRGARSDAARTYCDTCPVARECRSYAVADPYTLGWWGGTTEGDRRRLRRGG